MKNGLSGVPFIFEFSDGLISVMLAYFSLQWVLLLRRLRELGLHPILGITIIGVLLIVAPKVLFSKTAYAEYIIAVIAIYLVTLLSPRDRNDFLKITFPKNYRRLRIAENSLVVLPFVAILLIEARFLTALIVLLAGIAFAFIKMDLGTTRPLPTPFRRRPFEFIAGFRNTFPVFFCCYALAFISGIYRNPGIGLFSLLLSFLVCLSFYLKAETEHYVWMFAKTSKAFLVYKVGTALWQSTVLCLPLMLLNCFLNPAEYLLFIAIYLAGVFFLMLIVLCKYASFPGDVSLPNILLFAISLFFPPFGLLAAVYFYVKAVNNLNLLLNADH